MPYNRAFGFVIILLPVEYPNSSIEIICCFFFAPEKYILTCLPVKNDLDKKTRVRYLNEDRL